MTLLRTLMAQAARRLAQDPNARQQAVKLAKKAKPAVDKALHEVKGVQQASDPAREMGRLAGRLKKKYFDADKP